MDVSTIIVSYNTIEMTIDAIESVLRSSPEVAQEVIVVDNASPDASGEILRRRYEEDASNRVRIIQLDENRGFAAANNVGAAIATGHVLFFLNPDTVVEPGAIGALFRFVTSLEDAGAVGPHVLNKDGTDQESVFPVAGIGNLLRHFLPVSAIFSPTLTRKFESPSATIEVGRVKGCAIAIRREVFDAVGGWDESYFLYSEERELCFALSKLGYRHFFLREARIVHFGGASTSQENYADQQIVQKRSSLAFTRRHHGAGTVFLNRILGLTGFGIRAIVFGLVGTFTPKMNLHRRGQAARKIFMWYLRDYTDGSET